LEFHHEVKSTAYGEVMKIEQLRGVFRLPCAVAVKGERAQQRPPFDESRNPRSYGRAEIEPSRFEANGRDGRAYLGEKRVQLSKCSLIG
jgi:hypothetical protein